MIPYPTADNNANTTYPLHAVCPYPDRRHVVLNDLCVGILVLNPSEKSCVRAGDVVQCKWKVGNPTEKQGRVNIKVNIKFNIKLYIKLYINCQDLI